MPALRHLTATIAFCVSMVSLQTAHAIEICRTFNFAGFEEQTALARSVIGAAVTSDRKSMKVFVTVVKGQLFVQTNYVPPGLSYPAKLAIDSKVGLEEIVWNLITDDPAKVTRDEATKAMQNEIEFYVDRFRLNQSSFSDFDFTLARRVIWDPLASGATSATGGATSAPPQSTAQPDVTAAPSPQLPTVTQLPKSVYEAAIQFLWSSMLGRLALLVVAGGSVILTVWTALPDSAKRLVS
jgi:hypothetical protein